jgi:DNA-binding CsgD family transcriptional regulator
MSAKNLTSRELRKLSHAAADLYKATDQHGFGDRIHAIIKSVCTVAHAAYCDLNMETQACISTYSHPDIEEMANKAAPTFMYYRKEYPEISALTLNPKNQGKALRTSEILPRSLIEPTGYIEEYAKPFFCEFQIGYYFRTSGRLAFVSCNRNDRDFSTKEMAVIKFLAPHLQSAYENMLAFEARAARADRAAAMQQVIPQEMIWLDHDLAVFEITPRVPQLIKEFFDQNMRFKQLPRKLMDWLRAAKASEPLRPLIIRRADTSLKIRYYPERLPGSSLLTFHRQRTTPTLEDLKPLGLSRRESEVLLWLAQGKTNAEISRILYINRRTADWHVQSILSKLGVENRTSATLLVADLLQG